MATEQPRVSRFDPFLPRRSGRRKQPWRAHGVTAVQGVRRFRTRFAIAGLGLALAASAALPGTTGGGFYLAFALLYQLFWVGTLVPFAIPHYAIMIAFTSSPRTRGQPDAQSGEPPRTAIDASQASQSRTYARSIPRPSQTGATPTARERRSIGSRGRGDASEVAIAGASDASSVTRGA